MGTWGTRLTDDDLAADIIGDFFDRYNKEEEPKEIRRVLEKEYKSTIEDIDEGHMFWLSLAKAQWEIGSLDTDVLEKVKKIVSDDTDSKSWSERGATEKDVAKRRESIRNFAEQIKNPREKPKKPKKIKLKDAYLDVKLGIKNAEELKKALLEQTVDLDFSELAKDIESFLINSQDSNKVKLFREYINSVEF